MSLRGYIYSLKVSHELFQFCSEENEFPEMSMTCSQDQQSWPVYKNSLPNIYTTHTTYFWAFKKD